MQQLNDNLPTFTGKGKKRKNQVNKFKIDIDRENIGYLLDFSLDFHNPYFSKKVLRNMRKLLNIIDRSIYADRPEDLLMLETIDEVLICYLDKEIETPSIIAQIVFERYPHYKKNLKVYFSSISKSYKRGEILLPEDVSSYLCNFIEERLVFNNIFQTKDKLLEIFDQIDSAENLSLLNREYVNIIQKAYADNLKYKMDEQNSLDDFSSSDEASMDKVISKTIKEYQKPNNRIKMGIQAFNDLLGGGLENGRFYLACGLPKNFKSGILLNILIWTCKYNKFEFTDEDAGKIPTVFYCTQENSTRETINRIYINLTGKSIANYNFREAKRIFKEELLDKYGVCVEIKYRANRSISTLDFDDMITSIEESGNKKVVLAIQDYTKRIRSSNPDKELRLELANVSDDFCTIAKKRNIPIVSAAQLNRVAMAKVEEMMNQGLGDIGKKLNSSYIGESAGLIENADCSFTIFKERGGYEETDQVLADEEDDSKNYWLGVHLLATREKSPERTYFAQRFENGMKLQEDFGLSKSLSVYSISEVKQGEFNPSKARRSAMKKATNLDVDDEETFDEPYDDENDDDDIVFDDEKKTKKKNSRKKSTTKTKRKARTGTTSKKIKKDEEELLEEDSDDFGVDE